MKKMYSLFGILFVLCFMVGTASAAPLTFNKRSEFESAVGAAGALNFESFEGEWSEGATIDFGGFSVSETGGINLLSISGSFGVTDGSSALSYYDNFNSIVTFANFDKSINAFGLNITAGYDPVVYASIDFDNGSSSTYSNNYTESETFFFGIIDVDNLFTSIAFKASGSGGIAFDAVSYGMADNPAPEPATFILLGFGLVGLAGVRKKLRS